MVLNSSEATELECAGVSGGTWTPTSWYGGAPAKYVE